MNGSSIGDPTTAFIQECITALSRAGFDAGAFEWAKWAGIGCFIALTLAVLATFVGRLAKDHAFPSPLSDSNFKLLLIAGCLLIALPVVSKIAAAQMEIDLVSRDSEFAQRICEERGEELERSAETKSLHQEVAVLLKRVSALESQTRVTPSAPEVDPPLLGQAISVFYRSGRLDQARQLETYLTKNGAGVARRESDLTETNLARSARPGDTFVVFAEGSEEQAELVRQKLENSGQPVRQMIGPTNVRGNAIQILMF
ncbi:hypothetical protein [Falsiphaeobacter marinintestinus]|uniref:hypothetical protein n=1 Tax=Falsiphaeobacter marinintestinus TaxID=1492905 RepID=UPI0011B66B6D|nr:hypothetical protein [Phaeobacter marinintestinus]